MGTSPSLSTMISRTILLLALFVTVSAAYYTDYYKPDPYTYKPDTIDQLKDAADELMEAVADTAEDLGQAAIDEGEYLGNNIGDEIATELEFFADQIRRFQKEFFD